MSDLVSCAECGTRYDSDQNAFCPRCGSTARGQVVPAALAVARRNDPARRRVQASGALLLVVGGLFLVSSLVGLAVPVEDVSRQFVEPMADQAGGTLVLRPLANGTFDAVVSTLDGQELANVTGQAKPLNVSSPDHATLHVVATWAPAGSAGNASNGSMDPIAFDAVVLANDRLAVEVGPTLQDGDVVISSTLRTTVQVGRYVFIAVALVLAGGGLCGLLLRAWPLAAAASILGILLAAIVLVGFLVYGLLFALPFGFAAYFILRGRRHFQRKGE